MRGNERNIGLMKCEGGKLNLLRDGVFCKESMTIRWKIFYSMRDIF